MKKLLSIAVFAIFSASSAMSASLSDLNLSLGISGSQAAFAGEGSERNFDESGALRTVTEEYGAFTDSISSVFFEIGNDVIFGLAAGVWTNDIGRALRMSDALRAGTVWVNTYRAVSFMSPFGGYKRSGRGRESGQESIKEFLQTKSVWIAEKTSVSNPFIIR